MNTKNIFKLILIFVLICGIIGCYTKKDIEKYGQLEGALAYVDTNNDGKLSDGEEQALFSDKTREIEGTSVEAAGRAAAKSSTVALEAAAVAAVGEALQNSALSPTVPSYNTLKDNNQCLKNVTNENCMRCLYDIGVTANAGNQFGNSANYCRTTVAVNKLFNAGEIGYDNLQNGIQNNDGYSKNSYTTPPCGSFFMPIIPTNEQIINYSNCRKDSIENEKAIQAEEAMQEAARQQAANYLLLPSQPSSTSDSLPAIVTNKANYLLLPSLPATVTDIKR
jgi:hypothetical protein